MRYSFHFAYLLREDGKEPRVLHDRHVEGLFSRATWLRLLQETGFQTSSATRPSDGGELDEVFVGLRPSE